MLSDRRLQMEKRAVVRCDEARKCDHACMLRMHWVLPPVRPATCHPNGPHSRCLSCRWVQPRPQASGTRAGSDWGGSSSYERSAWSPQFRANHDDLIRREIPMNSADQPRQWCPSSHPLSLLSTPQPRPWARTPIDLASTLFPVLMQGGTRDTTLTDEIDRRDAPGK